MKVEFHPEAEMELIEAAAYYETKVGGLGKRFGREVERTIGLLFGHPEIGAAVDAELRRFALDRFPYTVIYSTTAETFYVLAVAHQSRRPGYWRSRAPVQRGTPPDA